MTISESIKDKLPAAIVTGVILALLAWVISVLWITGNPKETKPFILESVTFQQGGFGSSSKTIITAKSGEIFIIKRTLSYIPSKGSRVVIVCRGTYQGYHHLKVVKDR